MVDLAVVVVAWNVRELVLQALHTLLDDVTVSGLTAEVYVVDSGSSDGTGDVILKALPGVKVIFSRYNLGFGAANNLALRAIGFNDPAHTEPLPKAVYLLNPDTITHSGATRALYDALFQDERVGMVGARLSYGDGSFQHSAFAFPGLRQLWAEFYPTPGRWLEGGFNGRYPRRMYEGVNPFQVDFVLGATMMLRREVIEQVGLFDERFFLYCEEIDWAWRIQRAGWRIQCVPGAHVTHLGGQSTGQVRPQSQIYLWTSRLMLLDKHDHAPKRWLARRLVQAGMKRRLAQVMADSTLSEADRHGLLEAYKTILERVLS